uniref:Uncharacterized protein n=1 Tax=Lactuca sativa TaxID=4236 RepID=A0A9R1XSV3_LACSA|nr:hypothetical protein LSAT_V11C100044330 [Lactuca sativa]
MASSSKHKRKRKQHDSDEINSVGEHFENLDMDYKRRYMNPLPNDEDKIELGVEFIVHNPKQKWNHLNPKIREKYKSISQQKICIVNFVVANVYPIRFEKCETTMLIVTCGRSIDEKMPFSSIYFMDVQ